MLDNDIFEQIARPSVFICYESSAATSRLCSELNSLSSRCDHAVPPVIIIACLLFDLAKLGHDTLRKELLCEIRA